MMFHRIQSPGKFADEVVREDQANEIFGKKKILHSQCNNLHLETLKAIYTGKTS